MEDYSRSKSLAKFEHLGVPFGVVRRRFNGKTWRKYLTLVHAGVAMTEQFPRHVDPTNVEQVTDFYKRELRRLFPNTEQGRRYLQQGVETMLQRARTAI